MRGHQYVQRLIAQPITSKLTQKPPYCLRYFTDRLITAKDHASIQISVADVDENGVAQRTSTSFAISGPVRAMGESDDSINRLATRAGCKYPPFWSYNFYVLMPFLLDFLVDFSDFSAQKRLVVSKVDVGSRSFHYIFHRCMRAIEALFLTF